MLGSILFFPVAYSVAFVGLAALALDLPVSGMEVWNGAVVAAVSYAVSGKFGPILILIGVGSRHTSHTPSQNLLYAKSSDKEILWRGS